MRCTYLALLLPIMSGACEGTILGIEDSDSGLVDDIESPELPFFDADQRPGDYEYLELFADEFDRGQTPAADHWRHETMMGGNGREHRVPHIADETEGELGRRHAAWYNEYRDQTSFIDEEQGVLVQRGLIDHGKSEEDRRASYGDKDGVGTGPKGEIEYGDFRLYAAWLDTFSYVQQPSGERVPDPDRPQLSGQSIVFEPGTYFEIKVNFENMNMTGHRHSFWLMPVALDPREVKAYDNNASSGAEIDIYEHEYSNRANAEGAEDPLTHRGNNTLFMKTIAGDALTTTNESRSPGNFREDDDQRTAVYVPGVSQGWHRIGLLWTKDELIWYVDGHEVVRDSELVPQVPMYMILSREMNSGVNTDPAVGINRPKDPGLLGENVALKSSLEKLGQPENYELGLGADAKDHVLVDYIRAWRIEDAR